MRKQAIMDMPMTGQLAQNRITPRFRNVSFKDRFIARLYDTGMFWLFYFLMSGITNVISPLLGGLICYILFLLRDGFNGGAGFGKARQSILVISTDDCKECTYAKSILRNVISDISAILITIKLLQSNIGLEIATYLAISIVMIFDIWRIIKADGGQRSGDLIAHTQVVYWEDLLEYNIQRQRKEKALDEVVTQLKKVQKANG